MVSLRSIPWLGTVSAGLNDGWTVCAAPRVAMVAHVKVFIRAATRWL